MDKRFLHFWALSPQTQGRQPVPSTGCGGLPLSVPGPGDDACDPEAVGISPQCPKWRHDGDAQGNGLAGPCEQDPLLILVGRIPPFAHVLTTSCPLEHILSRSEWAWLSYRLSHSPSTTWSRRRQLMGSSSDLQGKPCCEFLGSSLAFLHELQSNLMSPAR